ncbi:MAG: hypothetical protein GWP61_18065 [Chloroflexi bacterium]|jgi:hypothetical protein|nr:hypothetical protein [Chloroflexota bacterium]
MKQRIGVECTFEKDGRVRVRRVEVDDRWLAVEQGRQWVDEIGRHVLIMVPGGDVQEILLSANTLQWELVSRRSGTHFI